MAISRSREYQADESGPRVTGDPLALAWALRKIEMGTRQLPLPRSRASAPHLMIANPFRGAGIGGCSPPTHPWPSASPAWSGWRATAASCYVRPYGGQR